MTEPADTETWRWVEAHFRRMGWKVWLKKNDLCPMVVLTVREPESKAIAFCPVTEAQFDEPANKMAPFIIQTIALAFGEHWKKEKAYARGLRRAAKALGVTPEVLLESLKSRTLDIEIEKFMETQGGDAHQELKERDGPDA